MGPSIDHVSEIIREISEELIEPRWRALESGDVQEKSPGDVVTIADVEAERALTPRLADLVPGSVVIGEEAVAADPSSLDALAGAADAWIVDPVDGTGNFADGSPDFGVMIARIHHGETVAAWIHLPIWGETLTAERGSGAFLNDERLSIDDHHTDALDIVGTVKTRFLPPAEAERIEGRLGNVGPLDPSTICSAVEYRRMATGELDYISYWRTYPWDHAPGALIVEQAGGHVARLEGDPYRVGDDRTGLLVARGQATWDLTHAALFA